MPVRQMTDEETERWERRADRLMIVFKDRFA